MKKSATIRKRIFAVIGLLLAVAVFAHTAVIVSGGAHFLTLKTENGAIASGLPEKKADCILVLGAGVWNGSPSPMLQDRLDLGAALYHAGASDTILVSGDNGSEYYNEPKAMAEYLIDVCGVPSESIIQDFAGFSTYDSVYRTKEIFCADSVIIVTQKYHLYRACYIATSLGLEVYGADAHQREYFGRHYREARECLARVKDFFLCIYRPNAKLLGEKLPIKGENK